MRKTVTGYLALSRLIDNEILLQCTCVSHLRWLFISSHNFFSIFSICVTITGKVTITDTVIHKKRNPLIASFNCEICVCLINHLLAANF